MKLISIAKKTGKILFYASGVFLGAYALGSLIAAWVMVRPGSKKDYDCIDHITFGKLEPVSLKTSDGVRLHAWAQWSHKTTLRRWVLLLHGYRSDRDVLHSRRRFYIRRGYHVLMLHFRGHGGSESTRISYGFNERKVVKAAVDFIRLIHRRQQVEIGIDGVSMGAAAAAYAVAYESINPDWVILESCYDNINQALENRLGTRVPVPLVPFVARPMEFMGKHVFQLPLEDLNPTKALESIHCPVLMLAGDSEKVLKTEEVEKLFQSIPEPKRLVFFPGAEHEDLLLQDPRRYIKTVDGFLREFSPSQADARKTTPTS